MPLVVRWSVLLFATVLAWGCDRPEPAKTASAPEAAMTSKPVVMRPVSPASGEALSQQSYLRDVLPVSAYAYARLPSLWGILGVPTGGALDKAVGSAPYADAVRVIREGFSSTVVPDLPEDAQFVTRLFLQHATSPIEAAALASPDAENPIPFLLVTAAVDFATTEALNAFLQQAAAQYPAVELLTPVQGDQVGILSIVGLQTQIKLDPASKRLYLLTGAVLQPTSLVEALKTLQPNSAHPMRPQENGIDASGQGLFVWASPPKLMELASAMGQQDQVAMLALFGLTSMKSVGIGMGTSGGIHRLKAVVEMPQMGFRAFLPVIRNTPAFKAAGAPKVIGTLGLPGPDDLVSIEAAAATLNSPEEMKAYREFKRLFAEKVGFTIDDIFAALGQDISFVADEAGQYLAVRVKDGEKFQSLIDTASQRFGLKYTRREIAGHTYHHLVIPSLDSLFAESMENEQQKGMLFLKRLLNVPSHLYWVQEGNYLIMASLPQVLMDRHYISDRVDVGQWLQRDQRMVGEGALLLLSARNRGLPALMYRMNLEALSYLGDMAERPVDMFALPTPREAGLPEEGAFGLKLVSSESQLAFEMAFENNPIEFLLAGNGYTGVAVAGILAAVAIPAYQDYTIRASVLEGMNQTRAVRQYLESFARSNGRFPSEAEVDELDLSDFETGKYAIGINPGDGRVYVEYYHDALEDGNVLVLTPRVEGDELHWDCEADMKSKYLPKQCR